MKLNTEFNKIFIKSFKTFIVRTVISEQLKDFLNTQIKRRTSLINNNFFKLPEMFPSSFEESFVILDIFIENVDKNDRYNLS